MHIRNQNTNQRKNAFLLKNYENAWSNAKEVPQEHTLHDDVIKWKHFPRYWSFLRGIHQWPVNSPHNGQWHGALMFSLICTWKKRWSKPPRRRWFEAPSQPLCRHRSGASLIGIIVIIYHQIQWHRMKQGLRGQRNEFAIDDIHHAWVFFPKKTRRTAFVFYTNVNLIIRIWKRRWRNLKRFHMKKNLR